MVYYCTTESVQAAILFWPKVAADLKKKKKKSQINSENISFKVCSEAGSQPSHDTDLL